MTIAARWATRLYACLHCGKTARIAPYCDDCKADMHPCVVGSCPTLLRGDAVVCRFHLRVKTLQEWAEEVERYLARPQPTT